MLFSAFPRSVVLHLYLQDTSETFHFPKSHWGRATETEPPHDKTNKMTVRPAKTEISLLIRPVWSGSSLCAQWVAKAHSFLYADSEDSAQTGRMPRLIWVFAGRTCHFVGFVMRRLSYLLSMPSYMIQSIKLPPFLEYITSICATFNLYTHRMLFRNWSKRW